jgi:outer membrane receptor for ferrienterochelin and colicins
MRKTFGFLLSISTLLHTLSALAEETPTSSASELLNLSLGELTAISIASKRPEPIVLAPGVVSVVSADEIRRQGYTSLRDILDRQAHLVVVGSNLFPSNKSTIRGVNESHSDSTVLLLVNGRPLREVSVSSINQDIYNYFPVHAIKSLEIVRGPGSVLYGTNAFSGVINIVTYTGEEKRKSEVALRSGSFGSKMVEANIGIGVDEVNLFASLHAVDIDGDKFTEVVDQFGNIGTYPMGRSGTQAVINANYHDIAFNALYSNSATDNVRALFAFPSTEIEMERYFADLGYSTNLNEEWSLISNITYNQQIVTLENLPEPSPATTGESDMLLLEAMLQGSLFDSCEFLAGLSGEKISGTGTFIYESYAKNIYSQLACQPVRKLRYIVGGQYNVPDSASGHFSPRLGAIALFNEYWNVKLLYSSAFRDPSPLERFVDIPSIQGDPNLSPEIIDTWDLQVNYKGGRSSLALTLFHSKQQDIISREAGPPVRTINEGEIIYQGIELEFRSNLTEKIELNGNASYQTNESDTGEKDMTYAPRAMLKAGINYIPHDRVSFNLYSSYISESTLQNDPMTSSYVNPEASSYILVSGNFRANLSVLTGLSKLSDYSVSVYVHNLLDEEIYFPSINRTEVNSLPHQPGRGIFFGLHGSF